MLVSGILRISIISATWSSYALLANSLNMLMVVLYMMWWEILSYLCTVVNCEFPDCSSNVKGQSEAEFSSSVRHRTSTSVSSGLDGTDEGRVSVGQSVVAPKKHSISVEARFWDFSTFFSFKLAMILCLFPTYVLNLQVGASLIRFIKEKGYIASCKNIWTVKT